MARRLYLIVAITAIAALNACGGGGVDPVPVTTGTTGTTDTTGATDTTGSTGASGSTGTTGSTSTQAISPAQVLISPGTVSVATGGSFQFRANVVPFNINVISYLTWNVSGAGCSTGDCGQVDARGLYTAPTSVPATPTITITATSVADPTKSAYAVVTIGPQASGTFTRTGDMTVARAQHTATLLSDGRVLIVGGYGEAARSAELYDPATGTFTATGMPSMPRVNHTATLLPNGQVLIAGQDGLCAPELYDPATSAFIPVAPMLSQQWIATATLLDSGKVLVVGSIDAGLFDPATRTFQRAAPYAAPANLATATRLADGRVLLIGDNPAQIYDPSRDAFTFTDSLASVGIYGIFGQTATLLNNGTVLVAGGSNDEYPGGRLALAELYDPAAGVFIATGPLLGARDAHSATLLTDGQVLIAGGEGIDCDPSVCWFAGSVASAELYSPATGTFAALRDMNVARSSHVATVLKNGDVLITGGFRYCGIDCFNGSTATAELYHPR